MTKQNKITKENRAFIVFILKVVIFLCSLNFLWLFVNTKVAKETEFVAITYDDEIEKIDGVITKKDWNKTGKHTKGYTYKIDVDGKSVSFPITDYESYSEHEKNDIIPVYKYKDYYELSKRDLAAEILEKEIKYPLIYVDYLLVGVVVLVDMIVVFSIIIFIIGLFSYIFACIKDRNT